MQYPYRKMQSAGNEFVLLDGFSRPLSLSPEEARRIADPRRGPGCDQVLVLAPVSGAAGPGADNPEALDVSCLIYNADGSRAGQCGNGACCAAQYLRDKALVAGDTVRARFGARSVLLQIVAGNRARAHLGAPDFDPDRVPARFSRRQSCYELKVLGERHRAFVLSLGNPHAVLCVADVAQAPVRELGPAIQALDIFPDGINVGFMQLVSDGQLRLRVFERGAGETASCGSGACAAMVAARTLGRVGEDVQVLMPGGVLAVHWAGSGQSVQLESETQLVSEGVWELQEGRGAGSQCDKAG